MSNTTAKKLLFFRGTVSQEKFFFDKCALISLIKIFIQKKFISIKAALDVGGGGVVTTFILVFSLILKNEYY